MLQAVQPRLLCWLSCDRIPMTTFQGCGWCAGVVDVCLIPEAPFNMQGEAGLLSYVQHLLDERGHCVICVAEGAGQAGLLAKSLCVAALNYLLTGWLCTVVGYAATRGVAVRIIASNLPPMCTGVVGGQEDGDGCQWQHPPCRRWTLAA